MCNLETEGIKYGCGHYVPVRVVRKIDCMRPTCTKSSRHPPHCNSSHCDLYFGPARKETIIQRTDAFCPDDSKYYGSRVR
ncbi:hypothetical protein BT96DRAFT_912038 [Gymnopus androsaceus JB14]|uniref:Uncharacterized protein n=1 Tax=Gymnopus androsaceus JB14 TaxID=1447944 RepID=A0A6A4ILW3_9AGAR|nr:hypothetical protein BT96DRAFT_912038 [Gymnopus androsaceus JB14]